MTFVERREESLQHRAMCPEMMVDVILSDRQIQRVMASHHHHHHHHGPSLCSTGPSLALDIRKHHTHIDNSTLKAEAASDRYQVDHKQECEGEMVLAAAWDPYHSFCRVVSHNSGL